MKNIWNEMVKILSTGESFVVATIYAKSGSAPRTAGAKMIIREDESIFGTIGGGRLEGETRDLARKVLVSQVPLIQDFNLTGTDAEQMDMICGGSGEVLLDYVAGQDPENLQIYSSILNILTQRDKGWLITALGIGPNNIGQRQQCLITSQGTIIGSFQCGEDFLQKLLEGPAKAAIHAEVIEDWRVLIEPICNTGTLYIFGAGHVSQQIAPIAEMVGFKTVVMDDRAQYACKERFPNSKIILLDSFKNPLPELELDQDSYLVIVTRGHLHDKTVLAQVLQKPVAYIGMIGSRRKRDMIYATLKKENNFTDEDFTRVHSPIGLDILAETPEEIAVSIVGELIKVRAERAKNVSP